MEASEVVPGLVLDPDLDLELDVELSLIRDAISLVAAGVAPRVVVANLRHGRAIEGQAREIAAAAGVLLGTLAAEDPRRIDLVAETAAAALAHESQLTSAGEERAVPQVPRAAAASA